MTDERDLIGYDEPRVLGEVFPDRNTAGPDHRRCSTCGTVLPADRLTVVKRRHARHAKGWLRIHCPDHAVRAVGGASGSATGPSSRSRPLDGRLIDTTYDFQTDTPAGKDPDAFSDTLHHYHRTLWSRELPDGTRFDLTDARPGGYLVHESDKGLFWLSSDAVVPTFPHKAAAVVAELDDGEFEAFWNLAYTIGGTMIWPGNRIGTKQTINGARGFHPRIADRFDLTVECVRRHYAGGRSPLGDVLARYTDFFALFETFEGFIDHFLLHDLLDGGRVRFAMPFDEFAMPSVPPDLATYRRYMETSMEFIHARNARIAAYAGTLPVPSAEGTTAHGG
ncbi:hypothetical protein [Nocardiopsis sp. CC223A]|uniref:DUF6994 family protein n=1 Tax=Nocardiopsis sp. CC223A TaxID=3044051 RepID=UPI00278C4FA9|nr:hypothetical protein [Nocardiopsis sp. CC223A]